MVEGPHPVQLQQLIGVVETDAKSKVRLNGTRLEKKMNNSLI